MNVNEDWLVSLSVAETDGQTRAEARLAMPGGVPLAGYGQAPSGVMPEFADIKTEDARWSASSSDPAATGAGFLRI